MWFLLSTISALSSSFRVPVQKRVINLQDEYIAMWSPVVFALPIAFVVFLLEGFVVSAGIFWGILFVRILLDTVASLAEVKAYKYGSISYVIPLMALHPVLTIFTGIIINKQVPSNEAVFGILLITIAVFWLFVNERSLNKALPDAQSLFRPTAYLLFTILLWSFLDPLHKEAIDRASSATYFFLSYLGFGIVFTIIVALKSRTQIRKVFRKENFGPNVFLGVSLAVSRIAFLTALSTGYTAYVIAIINSSIVFAAILGIVFFKESANFQKIFSILLAFVGVVVIGMVG